MLEFRKYMINIPRSVLCFIIPFILLSTTSSPSLGQTKPSSGLVELESDTSKLRYLIKISEKIHKLNPDSQQVINQMAISLYENSSDNIPDKIKEELARMAQDVGDYENAGKIYTELADDNSERLNTVKSITYYVFAGYAYSLSGKHKNSVELAIKALEKIDDKLNDSIKARSFIYTAFIYRNAGDIAKAEDYFKKCLNVSEKEKEAGYYHVALHELGNLYIMKGNSRLALKYQFEALKIREKLSTKNYLIYSFHDISVSYTYLPNPDSARYYLKKAIALEKLEEQNMLPYSYQAMANSYLTQKVYPVAKLYADSSYFFAKKYQLNPQMLIVYNTYNSYYDSIGDYKNAYKYYKLAQSCQDSISNQEIAKQINLLDIKYETAKKDKEIIRSQAEINKQRLVIFAFTIGSIIILLFVLFIIGLNKKLRLTNKILHEQKDEIIQKNEELKASSEEIVAQSEKLQHAYDIVLEKNLMIEEQNHNIKESITYAMRIQTALMPSKSTVSDFFPRHMMVFMPRDIVSGDFFWIKKTGDNIVFALADCTGHGVPAAFVSILGLSLLNEISRSAISIASEWMEILRKTIKQALNQDSENTQVDDGMNIALCIFNPRTRLLNYAGAYHPVLVLRGTEFIELSTTKQPIGNYPIEKPFENFYFQLQPNDEIYLYSDGVIDQFGGTSLAKFKKVKLRDALISGSSLNFKDKEKNIYSIINEWKKDTKQIDDITLIGVGID
jgi:serine phosphatase RsbU (regulator of sigma subunit)